MRQQTQGLEEKGDAGEAAAEKSDSNQIALKIRAKAFERLKA